MPDTFWDVIDAQLTELRTARTADDVIRILDPSTVADAFFAGSGGDGTVSGALFAAGWDPVWSAAPYYWVMRGPTGDLITYIEGDIYRGNATDRCEHCWEHVADPHAPTCPYAD